MTRTLDHGQRNPDWWEISEKGGMARVKRDRVRAALLANVPVNDICRLSGAGPSVVVHIRDDLIREGLLPKRGRGNPRSRRKGPRSSWIEALTRANSSVNGASPEIPYTEEVS